MNDRVRVSGRGRLRVPIDASLSICLREPGVPVKSLPLSRVTGAGTLCPEACQGGILLLGALLNDSPTGKIAECAPSHPVFGRDED